MIKPTKRQPLSPEAKAARLAKAAKTRAENKQLKEAWVKAEAAAKKANKDKDATLDKLQAITPERGSSAAEVNMAKQAASKLQARPTVTAWDKLEDKYQPLPLPATDAEWDAARVVKRKRKPRA
jgi:hypothetical protein